ncbi:uncharacterized protein HMPREF1541_07669 [Cyphellophora europaea CBS 101466]|uniref:DUF427 domain-containing protein n=1 Tax=Cyphellophora europaea (strain CBS 101466) TaxID=1220924 RepID=W2RNF8_CYPE1|nr:uncharacterized protein HMPREF1541_07669 [Cyphellophora europaea CBS 101466]ETN38046.1 hypothetical protein HMPREF1541_07669 [Cyphellophora europaea CBS 101466]
MSQITQLASRLFTANGFSPVKTLPTDKRVRGFLNQHLLFDTTAALLVWEHKFFPQYWIPRADFTAAAVFDKDQPVSGIESSTYSLTTKEGQEKKSVPALVVPESFDHELKGLVKVEFKSIDAWYEELAEVLFHPKDPFHRVDLLPSGRQVKVEVEGAVVADTAGEGGVVSLWETNFPGRWYLPGTAIRWQYLRKSDTKTGCPYKGQASYYDAVVDGKEVKDVVWYYENPTQESAGIKGLYCFYPDKVRTWVDGKEIERVGMPKPRIEGIRAAREKPVGEEVKKSGCGC